MIADEPRGLVHGISDQALEPKVGFCPRDEEGACGIQAVQAREVDEAAIHYIRRPPPRERAGRARLLRGTCRR